MCQISAAIIISTLPQAVLPVRKPPYQMGKVIKEFNQSVITSIHAFLCQSFAPIFRRFESVQVSATRLLLFSDKVTPNCSAKMSP